MEADRLLQQVKKESGQVIRIFIFPTENQLTLIGWSDAALRYRIDGGSTTGLLFTFFHEVLARRGIINVCDQLEDSCRSATVDLGYELFALRYQWSEISPDEMARLVPGACVTDSKGLHDKMQHTVITRKGKERRVDIEFLALKEGLETSSTNFFWVHSRAQLGNNLTKDTETEPSASFLRNGQRWRVTFDARFVFKDTWTSWDQYTGKPNEKGLECAHVCVYCTRTSTGHVLSSMHFFLRRAGRIFQWT